MRLVAAVLCGAAFAPSAGAAPQRVMSLSVCSDQLVLALLPPARIASVTWLARDPDESLMVAAAQRVGVNHGTAEEVLQERPDLVVASSAATPATRALLHRLGFPLIELGSTEGWPAIRDATRRLAAAFGVQPRGAALLARMDRELADLGAGAGPRIRVAAWDGAGFSAQPGTLYDAVLRAAGAVNIGNLPPASSAAAPDAETLLQAAPALLVESAALPVTGGPTDLRRNLLLHPLVRRFWQRRIVVVPAADTLCGTPYSADAAVQLRQDLLQAASAAQPLPFGPSP